MSTELLFLLHLMKVPAVVILAGIFWRRRAHLCWTFVAYLAAVLVSNCLFSFWPDQFYRRWFWLLQQGIIDALKMGIAVELAFRTFQAFPRASATARRVLLVLLIATSAALIGIPLSSIDDMVLLEWHPRVLTGTIWLMNGLAVLITWYRVPVHAYHKAILLGFVPYLLVFTTAVSLLKSYGWLGTVLELAEPTAFLALLSFWAWASWRPENQPDVSPALVRRLQPWRMPV
jgi:hypothetical protein